MVKVYKKNGKTLYDVSDEAKDMNKWFANMDKSIGKKPKKTYW